MKTPLGLDKDSQRVRFINDVETGLACNCMCPGCGADLIAKKGIKVVHHFSHYKAEEHSGCGETSLHLLGKALLLEATTQVIPAGAIKKNNTELSCMGTLCTGPSFINLWEADIWDIEEEVNKGDYQPDILCKARIGEHETSLAIEVAVTHKVEEEKLGRVQRDNLSMIEIDISRLLSKRILTRDDCIKELSNIGNISWIHLDTELSKHYEVLAAAELDQNVKNVSLREVRHLKDIIGEMKERKMLELPTYPFMDHFVLYRNRINESLLRKMIEDRPIIAGAYPIVDIAINDDYSLNATIEFKEHVIPLPMYMGMRRPPESSVGSFLVCEDPKVSLSLAWGRNAKAERYIASKKIELDLYVKKNSSKFQKLENQIRQILNTKKYPINPKMSSMQEEVKRIAKRFNEGMVPFQDWITNTPGTYILGCPTIIWQMQLLEFYITMNGQTVNVKTSAEYLESKGLETIEPYRSFTFSSKKQHSNLTIPSLYGLISKYHVFLEDKGLLSKNKWGSYQKSRTLTFYRAI